MAPKKKVSKKTSSKPTLCLRRLDETNHIMSDNEKLPVVEENTEEKLDKGMKRLDASTVVKV